MKKPKIKAKYTFTYPNYIFPDYMLPPPSCFIPGKPIYAVFVCEDTPSFGMEALIGIPRNNIE
jgi:hypothetical protein